MLIAQWPPPRWKPWASAHVRGRQGYEAAFSLSPGTGSALAPGNEVIIGMRPRTNPVSRSNGMTTDALRFSSAACCQNCRINGRYREASAPFVSARLIISESTQKAGLSYS